MMLLLMGSVQVDVVLIGHHIVPQRELCMICVFSSFSLISVPGLMRILYFDCDSYRLMMLLSSENLTRCNHTKLCAPALAPFKAYYEGDGFPDVFDLKIGVPKQSQAQHEMLNMLKPRLFL
ncbi:hypothetical protein MKX03_008226 [Papaver bracteatum]|nr:hypothetical protein MKX03_008226 [Papaver bracteatum]